MRTQHNLYTWYVYVRTNNIMLTKQVHFNINNRALIIIQNYFHQHL